MFSSPDDALMGAALSGSFDRVCRALARGANVDANASTIALTPLMAAGMSGHAAVVTMLMGAGADPEAARSSDGWTALMISSAYNRADSVAALIACGASANTRDALGWTALHSACRSGRITAVKALLLGGASVSARTYAGHVPGDLVRQWPVGADGAEQKRVVPTRYRLPVASSLQLCGQLTADRSKAPAIQALLAAASPWERRRGIVVAKYDGLWASG